MSLRPAVRLLACLLLSFGVAALASPITYDFSGTLVNSLSQNEGTVTGMLAVDGASLTSFSFNLSDISGLSPVTGSSYTLDGSDSQAQPGIVADSWTFTTTFDPNNPTAPITGLAVYFGGLPGALTGGGVNQGALFGNTIQYSFSTGSALPAEAGNPVPEPASGWLLLAGGLLLVGWLRKPSRLGSTRALRSSR